MNDAVKWLIGLRQLAADAAEGDWRLEFQSLPHGLTAVLCAVIAVLLIGGVWLLYKLEGRNLRTGVRVVVATLRLVTLACVALMLLDIVLVIDRHEKTPSRLIVLLDTSESMGLADPYDESTARRYAAGMRMTETGGEPDVKTLRESKRLDLARRSLDQLSKELSEGRDVSVYAFDSKIEPAPDADTIEKLRPQGASTAIGNALRQSLAAHRGQPLAGVLMLTDGQSNGGEDPRKVAQQAGREATLIHSVVIGTEKGPSNVRLADLEASPVVFVRDPTQLVALVESQGMQGRTAIVKLERRQSGSDWSEVGQTEVNLGEDGAIQRVPFSFVPENTGQFDFRASVIDAGVELTEDDNSAAKSIKVVRQRIRVLLIASCPSPEVQFLRNALLRDPAIEFSSWLQDAGENYEQIGYRPLRRLPNNAQELAHYDVVILFDPNMKELGRPWVEMLTKFVGDAGGGLIYVAGELHTQKLFETALSGANEPTGEEGLDVSWVSTLPVVVEPGLYQSGADVKLSARETWNLELTADGSEDPIFRFAPEKEKNREILASLPGMYWYFQVTRAKPGATVLAQHGDQRMRNQYGRHVLMATQRYGPGRTMFIGFDATYRWRYLHEQHFDGFWARLADRVGRSKVLGGRYPFTLATDKSVYRTGEQVTVKAQMVGGLDDVDSTGKLQAEVDLAGEEPIAFELEPVVEQPGLLQGSLTVDKGGAYIVRVSSAAQVERDPAIRPATLAFRVEPPRQETDKPGTNRPLLEDLAKASGGRVFTPAELAEIPSAFPIKQVDRVLEYREEMWDAPLWALVIVSLLTIEWVIRKIYRMA